MDINELSTRVTRLSQLKIHFSDFFNVSDETLQEYGAFNVSLVNDLPLFIDPFLLFTSSKPAYRKLHDDIIEYLRFLRDKSATGRISDGLLKAWYIFSEVKQNWLGYSLVGNRGSGLGPKFAKTLYSNLGTVFTDFGEERVATGSHVEKLCLIESGVGRDNISDFTVNLIKGFLLEYTQAFAKKHIKPEFRKMVSINRVRFNYSVEAWERGRYDLPFYNGDYVILTPKDILTKENMWINRQELIDDFMVIAYAISNIELREQLSNYIASQLQRVKRPSNKDRRAAIESAIRHYPEILEYYIREKENTGDKAQAISDERVAETQMLFVEQLAQFVSLLISNTGFYTISGDTFDEARSRVEFLKDIIENKDGYRLFYIKGKPIAREQDLHILFRLTWYSTPSDVNREVNNGRGPVDFKISRGSGDKSLVEFKLASNSQLKRNLQNQVKIYESANDTDRSLKVIIYFSRQELFKVQKILNDLKMQDDPNIVLIDACRNNKLSASKA